MPLQKIAAFSDGPVGGNPAGVWTGDALPPPAEMQRIAAGVGFSETAFAAPQGSGDWRVRYIERQATPFEKWFTGFVQGRIGHAWLQDSDLARILLARAAPRAEGDLQMLEQVLANGDGKPVKVLAHCFCGL